MTEKQVQDKIIKILKSHDFICFKIVVGSVRGIPDLVCISPTGIHTWIEVKTEKGKLSALQTHKIEMMKKNNVRVIVVYGLNDFKSKYYGAGYE